MNLDHYFNIGTCSKKEFIMINRSATLFYFCFILSSFTNSLPHGFCGNTLIKNTQQNGYQTIEALATLLEEGERLFTLSYDEANGRFVPKRVVAAGVSEAPYYIRIIFKEDVIACSHMQLFYRLHDQQWVAAYMLRPGDELLCENKENINVIEVELVNDKLKTYMLEVKHTHNFLVTRYAIVSHNILIPIAATIGFTIPFNLCCSGATVGSFFGPPGICIGVAIGGLIGCLVSACIKEPVAKYKWCSHPQAIDTLLYNNNDKSEEQSVEDLLGGAIAGKEKRFSKQFFKEGDYEQAVDDFESLRPTNVKNLPNDKEGKTGTLPDGRNVNVRKESSAQCPTLEIQNPENGSKDIKVRYVDKT